MKNYNMVLTEKQQQYQHDHLEKFININILQAKKYYHLINEEQVKFTCSSSGKAFERQTKTTEEQARKQVSAIEEHGKQLVKSNEFPEKEKSTLLDSKKKYSIILLRKKTGEIEKLHNSVNFQNLIYHFKGPTKDIDFNDFTDAETLFDDIKSKKIRLEDAEKNQMEFESKLRSGRIGGNKAHKQLIETENIAEFYKLRDKVIKFYHDYFKMIIKLDMIQNMEKNSKY